MPSRPRLLSQDLRRRNENIKLKMETKLLNVTEERRKIFNKMEIKCIFFLFAFHFTTVEKLRGTSLRCFARLSEPLRFD